MMKKNYTLPLYFLCVCGISACTSTNTSDEVVVIDNVPYIDATDGKGRCGVDGIGCNDSALVNYTRTEADYRAYGERTKRDHLYTQAGAGNNLTASIPPAIEEDVVFAPKKPEVAPIKPRPSDGVFVRTDAPSIEAPIPNAPTGTVAPSSNVVPQAKSITSSEIPCGTPCYGMGCVNMPCSQQYEVICQDTNCESLISGQGEILSEFTEDSFDIANYVEDNKKSGGPFIINAELDTDNLSISDTAILTWEANEGDNLRELLTKWSALAGWKLLWQTNRNYVLNAGVMFKGKFADVSSALVRAFARARPAPIATFYKGNRVIVVETMENENAY